MAWSLCTMQVLAAVQCGAVGKLTIPELKCYLKAAALPLKGKKEELFARICSNAASAAGTAGGAPPP